MCPTGGTQTATVTGGDTKLLIPRPWIRRPPIEPLPLHWSRAQNASSSLAPGTGRLIGIGQIKRPDQCSSPSLQPETLSARGRGTAAGNNGGVAHQMAPAGPATGLIGRLQPEVRGSPHPNPSPSSLLICWQLRQRTRPRHDTRCRRAGLYQAGPKSQLG